MKLKLKCKCKLNSTSTSTSSIFPSHMVTSQVGQRALRSAERHCTKRQLRLAVRSLAERMRVRKIMHKRVGHFLTQISTQRKREVVRRIHCCAGRQIRLYLAQRWAQPHQSRMTLCKALLAWSIMSIRMADARRVAREHEALLDADTPPSEQEVEQHNQDSKRGILERELEMHHMCRRALGALYSRSLHALPRLVKANSSQQGGRYAGRRNRYLIM